MKVCPHCGNGPNRMSIEEFKATFKPGDYIQGWATKKVVRITGIGNTRFFFDEPDGYRKNKEFAQTIRVPWLWVKVEPATDTDLTQPAKER